MGNCLLVCRTNTGSCIAAPAAEQTPMASEKIDEKMGGGKRIRLVITKQQLRQLLSEEISIREVQSLVDSVTLKGFGPLANQRPKLECIPEGDESG
ncbi:hypothetical protein MLD38_025735 [Melastoma candidum]|uniref:Uncharacterized protein n=1 Tax=Melastoma candidum TaxID=119954 RepID=A0ACB9NW17_9MYRT|nr:hypothetical protein MLD38_025735 [Melastoma candidum]